MRVFITPTPDELEPHQEAAVDVVRELGHEPVLRDPAARRGLDPVTACRRQVARADAVLAIVGWRRGRVPPATLGGDNLRPWSYWEVRSAFEHGVPVVALLAGEGFAPELREEVPEARAVVADCRGELARLAAVCGQGGIAANLPWMSCRAGYCPPSPSRPDPPSSPSATLSGRLHRPPPTASRAPFALPYAIRAFPILLW